MSQIENKNEKESKIWLVGMIGVISAVALLVVAAILIQHQQMVFEAASATTIKSTAKSDI